ncbi:MAG TPA: DUF4129 domain-containing protein [Gaiellales bacterium]
MTADGHVRLVARAAAAVDDRLPAARRAAQHAIGVRPSGHSLLRRLADRAIDWLSQLIPSLTVSGSAAGLLGYVLLAGIVAAALLVAIRSLSGRRGRARRAGESRPAAPAAAFADARAAALRLAPADPLEALREIYAALLRELGSRRGWRPLPGRSNWAFVRRLGPGTGQGRALAECTRVFEGRVYGSQPADEADVRRVDELADAVLA